jgi:N-acyl-D-aspartate/D-glutamate deacylase
MTAPRANRLALLAIAAACAMICFAPAPVNAQEPTPTYDILILGGHVIDGTGASRLRADVAILGDRLAAIGDLDGSAARDTIDATGLIVAPGFIDMLGHSEFRLLADGRAISKIYQGVTSEITGEVTSVVPASDRPRAQREREYAPWGITYTWDDLDGYFAELERRGTAINVGTWVGLSSLRLHGVGPEERAAEPAEVKAMKDALAAAMEQGAFGLSSGLSYAPGRFASTEEITELSRVAAEHGGFYATHMRSEGARLLEAIDEAITIGERSGAPVLIHHLKASGRANWGKMAGAVEKIQAARDRGVDVMANVYPYTASSTGLNNLLPDWAEAGTAPETLARLRDPAFRNTVERSLGGTTPNGEPELATSAGGPGGVLISDIVNESLTHYEGMRLDAVAKQRGQSPIEALIDLLLEDELRTGAIFFTMDEADLIEALRQPWTMIGGDAGVRAFDGPLSDDTPHPRAFGSFPRVLCRYSREQGLLSLEEAVHKMTGLAAARAGLDDRGTLARDHFADVAIFDADTVCDRATFENPKQLAVGVHHVIVNGVPVLRDGEPTGARPGRGLRRSTTSKR